MNKTELARLLGVSRQMIYKLIDQGMPIDSVESAKQWRRKALNPLRTKYYRAGLMQARIARNENLKQPSLRQNRPQAIIFPLI